jgi:glutamate-1-semialdehyde aminotransferase
MWHLDPDVVTIGKAVAGGLPMGAYVITAELREQVRTYELRAGFPALSACDHPARAGV